MWNWQSKKTFFKQIAIPMFLLIFLYSCGGSNGTQITPQPPIANAGSDSIVLSGTTVTLDASGSFDPDGVISSFLWSQTGGTVVTLSDATAEKPQFTAPGDTTNGPLVFLLTVDDDDGLSDSDAVDITVTNNQFVDDFSTDTTGDYTVTHTMGGTGQFIYDSLGERVQVLTGTAVALQFSHSLPASSNSTFHVMFSPIVKYQLTGMITIRLKQDDNNYYELSNRDGFSIGNVTKYVNGIPVESQQFQSRYSQNNDYRIVISFNPQQTVVDAFGEIIILNSDNTDILVNSFEIETEQQDAYFDDIVLTKDPYVGITQPVPVTMWGKPNADIVAQAVANNVPTGWGVRFALDDGTGIVGFVDDVSAPYGTTFMAVVPGVYSIDAFIINDSGIEVPGTVTHAQINNVGIGQYYVAYGDSITVGEKDDIPSDDISLDGRNSGGGFEPVLNDLLTAALNYPHTVVNEGISGANTSVGVTELPSVIATHSDAQFYLLLFGTNDANAGRSKTSYKNNMQQMITIISNAGKTPLLAKVPVRKAPCDGCTPYNPPGSGAVNSLIRDYNSAIDELVLANGITVSPPDFYNHFLTNINTEFADDSHPNGLGYQSMAVLWADEITFIP